jgi:hypothetical protein
MSHAFWHLLNTIHASPGRVGADLLQTVSKSSSRWFADDPKHVKAGCLPSGYGGVPLLLSKVGWDGEDRLDDGALNVVLNLVGGGARAAFNFLCFGSGMCSGCVQLACLGNGRRGRAVG